MSKIDKSKPTSAKPKTLATHPTETESKIDDNESRSNQGSDGNGSDFTMQGGAPVYTLEITGQLIDRTTLRTSPGNYIKIPPEWVPNDIFENDEYSLTINISRHTPEP